MAQSNIAYAKKNRFYIKLRSFRFSLYKLALRVAPRRPLPGYTKIFLVPSSAKLSEATKNKILSLKEAVKIPIYTNDAGFSKHFQLDYLLEEKIGNDTLILVIDFSFTSLIRYFPYLQSIRIVDENFWSFHEANGWVRIFNDITSATVRNEIKKKSRENLKKLIERTASKEKSVCFVTGPSFDDYNKFHYDNCVKVICNSIVKNEAFLTYIKGPDVLAFADPVFHMGLNPYGEEFRNSVSKVIADYSDCIIVTTHSCAVMMTHLMPEVSNNLIGFDSSRDSYMIDLEKMSIYPTDNVLTLLMLPVAALVSKEIAIIGADGREKSEKYFWKHNKSVQFNGAMDKAFEFHPSFFRDRIYTDYYDQHCDQLEQHLQDYEKHRKTIVTLTNSHIPALQKRTKGVTL